MFSLARFDTIFGNCLIIPFALGEGCFGTVVSAVIFVMFTVAFFCSSVAFSSFSLVIHSGWLAQT